MWCVHRSCSTAPHGVTEHSLRAASAACQPGDGGITDTHGAPAGTGAVRRGAERLPGPSEPLHASTAARRPQIASFSVLRSKKLQAAYPKTTQTSRTLMRVPGLSG